MIGRADLFDAQAGDTFLKHFAIDRVVVTQQISWRIVIRKRLDNLLARPTGRRMLGDIKVNYYNPKTGESLRPDLNHADPIAPHWDYRDAAGKWWRIFQDGRMEEK